jgi:hypothetical protein
MFILSSVQIYLARMMYMQALSTLQIMPTGKPSVATELQTTESNVEVYLAVGSYIPLVRSIMTCKIRIKRPNMMS